MDASEGTQAPQNPPTDGWTLVTRRRRPLHFLPSPTSPPKHTRTLNPHPSSYAQALQSIPPSMPITHDLPQPPQLTQNSTNLPYPPSPHQKEWWGRCFRCARKGHVVAECTVPRPSPPRTNQQFQPLPRSVPSSQLVLPSQPVQSQQAHSQPIRSQHRPQTHSLTHPQPPLPQMVQPPLPPPIRSPTRPQVGPSQTTPHHTPPPLFLPFNHLRLSTPEPGFDEFLTDNEPQEPPPPMPFNRPKKLQCYFNRENHYLQTLQKLTRGIVVQPPAHLNGHLSLDQVALVVAASGKVSTAQLQVAILTNDRFLVLLPDTLSIDQVIAAIPRNVWDEGYRFHSYSPLTDASISIPSFKVWIDIHGVPLELGSDLHLMRMVSAFGVFLGSREPRSFGDYQTCTVFIATDDLSLILCEIELRIGGLAYTASITPRKWLQKSVFHRTDLPPMMFSYPPPRITPPGSPRRPLPAATFPD